MVFEKAGKFKLSKSGKSFAIWYLDPNSLFGRWIYLNRNDVHTVDKGEVKEGPIFILAAEENNKSCGTHRS